MVAKGKKRGSRKDWEFGVRRCNLFHFEWIKNMCYIYTREYYSAIKKSNIFPFAATWMELESLILCEVRKRKTNTI